MGMEQGTGGGFGRSSRAMSTSGTRPNVEAESLQAEADGQLQQAVKKDNSGVPSETSRGSPRQIGLGTGSTTTSRVSSPALQDSFTDTTAMTAIPPCCTSSLLSRATLRHHPCSRRARLIEPPVTRATLSELDVTKIVHNPKLRHDINFDPELHFRPNMDGEKGRRKQEKAHQFWHALQEELTEFMTDRPNFERKHGQSTDWTLPALLKAAKEIIQTLVPSKDRPILEEGLNLDLLMQQFNKGIADLEKLASWLSNVLKSHCAPMRDAWVDGMYQLLSDGNRTGDVDKLVLGMRTLLSILEAMKLDVANHQIRCLRPVLIEDTSQFERRLFTKKVNSRKLDISLAKEWYRQAHANISPHIGTGDVQHFGDMGVFFEALSKLILPSSAEYPFPNTFHYDEDRLQKMRFEALDAINLDLCMQMFVRLERRTRTSGLELQTPALADPNAMEYEWSDTSSDDRSRPASIVNTPTGSAGSSPRTSLTLPSYVTSMGDHEFRTRFYELRDSLVVLLHSVPASCRLFSRWEMMAADMALQIFRFTEAPAELLPVIEEELAKQVSSPNSPAFLEMEKLFHNRLMAELRHRVKEFKSLSGVGLYSVATGAKAPANAKMASSCPDILMRDARDTDAMAGLATRLSHVGVLHWRCWSSLAYDTDTASLPATASR